MFIYTSPLSNGIDFCGVGNIGKFRVLEDSLKKSFSNVRMDIVSIKDYLEKQHDMLNSEIGELQSQIITVQRDMTEKVRETGEHATRDELQSGLEDQKELFRDLVRQNREIEGKLANFEKMLVRLQSEKAGSDELSRKEADISKETRDVRNELYREMESIDRKFRDTKLKISEEQERIYAQKMKRLDKGLDDMEAMKKELRGLVREGRRKGLSEERLKRVEQKIGKKPFLARFWEGLSEFLFEEEPLEEEERKVVVVKRAERPKPRPKKKRSIWPWIIALIIILLAAGLIYLILSGKLAPMAAGIVAAFRPSAPKNGTVETGPVLKEPIVSVVEGDFVDITPNISDPDTNDKLIYAFSEPLNSSGQWQTKEGDAGIYPVSVIVSDGTTDTKLEFTLVVKTKQ
jgi:hypothetical protein